MNRLKNILLLILVLIMVLSLCACGETPDTPGQTTTQSTESISVSIGFGERPTDNSEDDEKLEYVITVQDTEGNPIPGAMVQICKDACLPGITDANGVAKFPVTETGHKVSFVSLPENYVYVDASVTEWYFENGSMEMTIQLQVSTNGSSN